MAIARPGRSRWSSKASAESLARELTGARFRCRPIGIGGSPACDGQILVIDDMLGMFTEFTPRFVKRYRNLGDDIRAAARDYAEEVRNGRFPAAEHTYAAPRRQNRRPRSSRFPQRIDVIPRKRKSMCGRPPPRKDLFTAGTVWSVAVMCPAFVRGRIGRWPR